MAGLELNSRNPGLRLPPQSTRQHVLRPPAALPLFLEVPLPESRGKQGWSEIMNGMLPRRGNPPKRDEERVPLPWFLSGNTGRYPLSCYLARL